MLKTRIIPCLDVVKNKVVKGVNFKNIKVLIEKPVFEKNYKINRKKKKFLESRICSNNQNNNIQSTIWIWIIKKICLKCLLWLILGQNH